MIKKVKQISRPTRALILLQIIEQQRKPNAIFLSPKNYKKLCKEMKHKVKKIFGMNVMNYYDNSKS